MLIFIGSPFGRAEPAVRQRGEWRRLQVVELVAALAPAPDEAGCLQDLEMLRDRLSCHGELVPGRQSGAELEQRLPVPFREFVEDRASRGIRQGLEDVTHGQSIGK
jgi:hypothetical protein